MKYELEKESSNKIEEITEKIKSYLKNLRFWMKKFIASLTIISLVGLIIVPIFIRDPAVLTQFFYKAMIFSIFAASWDFLAGFVGQVSFGHAAFLGIGSYFSAFFVMNVGFHWSISLLIGSIMAVGVGLVIAIPSLRLKGPYFALGTLVFSLILYTIFHMPNFHDYIGEISGVPTLSPNLFVGYYIYLAIMVISLIILLLLGKSNFGTKLKSIRDDDKGAQASGINISKQKIYAFMISAFFAGIAGGLFAFNNRGASYSAFGVQYSFYPIIFTAIGGIATITGSALGTFIFLVIQEIMIQLGAGVSLALFVLSIALLVVIRTASEGILKPLVEDLKDLKDILLAK